MANEPPRSLVLETCVRLVFHAVLVTSLFFLFSGHSAPGGGFVGGLVAGTALVLRYLVRGDIVAAARIHPATLLGAGLVLAAGTAAGPLLVGGQVLQSAHTDLHVPVLGDLPLNTAVVFDSGVYLIVVGIVLGVLATLGTQVQASLGEDDEQRAAAPDAGSAR